MTSGRAVVLGDIGPWACAGMTGGRVYVRVNPEWNLDRDAIERRLGEGAKVELDRARRRGRCSTSRTCSATTPTSCGPPIRRTRPSGSWPWPPAPARTS